MENNKTKTGFLNTTAAKIIIAAAAVILLLVIFYAAAIQTGNKIAKGISVNGTYIGGKSTQDAIRILSEDKIPEGQIITVRTPEGAQTSFSAEDIQLAHNAEETAKKAYELSRTGNAAERVIKRIQLYFSHTDLPFECDADTGRLDELLYNFGAEQNGELQNYILDFNGDYVNVSRGKPGQSRDVSKVRNAVLDAAAHDNFTVSAEFEKSEPPVPDIDSLYDAVYIAPVDARYEITGGSVQMFAEQNGRQIDKIEAGTQLERLKNGETITLKVVTLTPEVTLASLNGKLFNHTLGEYSTQYSTSVKNRCKNVELAASKINGTILAPGEDFSYNKVVGERTRANGFLDAPVFENGETVQGIGGGVCQVSSTLYCAVLYADLQIVTRRNHSLTVAYVPKGQDATVAYGSIDFQFKNNTAYPVKILASAAAGRVSVSVAGTKPDAEKKVKITNNVIETKAPKVEEVSDPSLMTGSKKVLSAGKTGYTVETIRTVYENGVETKSEKMGRSVYKSVPSKVAVGSAVPTPMPTLVPRVTPQPETAPTAPAASAAPAE